MTLGCAIILCVSQARAVPDAHGALAELAAEIEGCKSKAESQAKWPFETEKLDGMRCLVQVAWLVSVGARPAAPPGTAAALLRTMSDHLGELPPEAQVEALDGLSYVHDDAVFQHLLPQLEASSVLVRRKAAEVLNRLATRVQADPEMHMQAAFSSEEVFRAARDSDARVKKDARCVLSWVKRSLDDGLSGISQVAHMDRASMQAMSERIERACGPELRADDLWTRCERK